MTAKTKKRILLAVIVVVPLSLVIWIAWDNTALELNTYTVTSSRLPKDFDGYCIARVSDLHNAEIGEDNEKLLTILREAEPDLIAITGDLIDSRNTDVEVAHEYDELKVGMEAAGIIILEDAQTELRIEGQTITLIGVNDPSFHTDYLFGDSETVMSSKLTELHTDGDGFTILLSHRPELFETYADHNIDLVLSGHAHGGQLDCHFLAAW